ncbi:MAG: diguanylate cyclase, partial [Phycisphaerales bacterium]
MPEADSLRVLVVDDDPSALVLLTRYLTRSGYEVLTAANGVEAIRVLMTEGAPIVITDWVMPEMDGLELCRAIRKHEGIPFAFVIIVTAYQTADDRLVEAFDAGADDYLCKPYNPKELLARLRAGERVVRLQREVDNRNREVHRHNAEIEIAYRKLAVANERLDRMASTDELTGLVNRREAMVRLGDCWASVERHGGPLACIVLDIDRFKSVNDTYGHAIGDVVLRETAKTLRASARREEAVCRIGGEEFLVICPCSSEPMAAVAAERLRRAVEANAIPHDDLTLCVTVSAGVAQRTANTENPDDLLRAADNALYVAKDAGRNTV